MLAASCSSENGHSVVGDQLTVFYDNLEDEKIAEDIAVFWRENDLLTGSNQDLKLIVNENNNQLFIIQSNVTEKFIMPFEERVLLLQLQKDLNTQLPNSFLEIVICDNQFKPIYNIN